VSDIIAAHRRLEAALLYGINPSNTPFDEDAPVADDLQDGAFSWQGQLTTSAARSRIRYLAALFPDQSFQELCATIGGILLDGRELTASDVRMILAGRDLANGTRTDEVDIERIQQVGKLLREGRPKTEIAKLAGVSRDTVQAIDWYLGLSEALRQKRIAVACDLVRDQMTTRRAATVLGVSKSEAHRLLRRAKSVLGEIGEVVV
jgi:transposase